MPQLKKITVDVVIGEAEGINRNYTNPPAQLETIIPENYQLILRPVERLRYEYDSVRFAQVCGKEKLKKYEMERVRDLIFINNGCINTMLLRAHLTRGYGLCARLVEELIKHKLAVLKDDGDSLYRLGSSRRSNFM